MTNGESIKTLEELWELFFKEMEDKVTGELDDFKTTFDVVVSACKQQETEYWIEDWESGLSECPVCHETYLWEDFKGIGSWHYCPNCGKKLEVKRQ